MSRIGNRKLEIPTGVTVTVDGQKVTVKGPKGELSLNVDPLITVKVDGNTVECTRANETKNAKSQHGTTNSLIENMLIGTSVGFEKGLEINGVGYRFNVAGNKLTITAGFSHPVVEEVPAGLSVEQVSNTEITVKGIDKQRVSEFAANIRKWRKPEPYKGKGIRYKDEYVRRKEGKKAAK
ncbi:MAG TPA: 50S ribosomal protein L6 [Firmicutes bacterium]|nr:50S ribosomal protein L6 [Bacillota bacterium]